MTIPAFLSTEPRKGSNEANLHRRLVTAQQALKEIHRIARDTSIGSPKDRLDRIVSEAQLAVLAAASVSEVSERQEQHRE